MAYAQIEPFGQGRSDLGAGVIAATMANVSVPHKKGSKPFEPKDFMPGLDFGLDMGLDDPKKVPSKSDSKALTEGLKAAFSQLPKAQPPKK